jgi:succinate dehydrogenase/fumarate reductase flavoprotein subunit
MMQERSQKGHAELDTGDFAEGYDVIVAGYGFGGGIAAIEAARQGAKVLICEKMPQPGGISICSGGAVRCAADADAAFAYLTATNAGTTPDDVLRALADGMATAESYLKWLVSAVPGASLKTMTDKKGGNYPFPGWQTFYSAQVEAPAAIDLGAMFPNVRTKPSSGAPALFWLLNRHLDRLGVDVRLGTPVKRLVRSAKNEIRGIVTDAPHGERRIAARRAVILACGGFEANAEMKRRYWEGRPVLTASTRGNTGDGVHMAQAVGADLWHMWHFHGCYAFRHPDADFPFALRVKRLPDWNPAKKSEADVKMVWIVVDRSGRRYMNESPPYCQDTAHRPMHLLDPETMSYPRNPSWLITDERGRCTYPLGDVRTNDHEYAYDWSSDNRKEIALGVLHQAASLDELASAIGADASALKATIARWNMLCDQGCDADFGRPGGTMARIDTPPYCFGEVFPAVSNTQGGPVHNPRQQILDTASTPIARLYSAGELGSSFGHLYLSGGNIAECFVTGWIAGREAAALVPWDAEAAEARQARLDMEIART